MHISRHIMVDIFEDVGLLDEMVLTRSKLTWEETHHEISQTKLAFN